MNGRGREWTTAALLDGSEWDYCCAGEGGSKTKWLMRAALLGGLQGGRNVDEGCAASRGRGEW